MEKNLFDWQEWDEVDTFYDCTLKVTFDEYRPGDKFTTIVIDFEKGLMYLWRNSDDREPEAVYELALKIGRKVRTP